MANYPICDDHKHLQQGLEKGFSVTINDWNTFSPFFYSRTLSQHEHWIKAGDVCMELCYILEGLIRVYYIDESGNEVNQHFYQAGEVIAPINAIISKEPCQYFIQALEPTRLMLADYNELYAQGYNNPEWLRLEVKMLQRVFVKSARHEARLLLGNADQRYLWFKKAYPELLERLAQYHIASFLGITPVSLSRLRKKLE
jgi:CRP-like cAMP-binding protein